MVISAHASGLRLSQMAQSVSHSSDGFSRVPVACGEYFPSELNQGGCSRQFSTDHFVAAACTM